MPMKVSVETTAARTSTARLAIAVAVGAVAFLAACGESEEPPSYVEVGTTFNRMHRDPAQACEYTAAHQATFDEQFRRCGTGHVDRLSVEVRRLQAECDAIFVDGFDRLKCEEDRGVPALQQQTFYLSAVLEVTARTGGCGQFNCSCTNFANYFQPKVNLFNAVLPTGKTWQAEMDAALDEHQRSLSC